MIKKLQMTLNTDQLDKDLRQKIKININRPIILQAEATGVWGWVRLSLPNLRPRFCCYQSTKGKPQVEPR